MHIISSRLVTSALLIQMEDCKSNSVVVDTTFRLTSVNLM